MIAALALAMGAAQTPYQQHHCNDPGTQQDMNFCAALDFQTADQALNMAWRDAIARARATDRNRDRGSDKRPGSEAVLRNAQRAWIQFRDAHCTYYGYEVRGGTMEPMLYNACRAQLTRERTSQLKNREYR